MPLSFSSHEILETIRMIQEEHLDIRTVTMGISLRDCADANEKVLCRKIYDKITSSAQNLVSIVEEVERSYGIPIINRRISLTPISLLSDPFGKEALFEVAITLEKAAAETGVNFIGGYGALVHKGFTKGDRMLIESIPEALSSTSKLCSFVNVATTKSGINMDAVYLMGKIIKETAELTRDADGIGCAKLVVFCNTPEDNPFMAGSFHGIGEAECVINVGVSGPGVVRDAVLKNKNCDLGALAETIKKSAFKVTRMGELIGRTVAQKLGVEFGVVDLSLAPTPTVGDSVAEILKAMGLEEVGSFGSTAALALLNDAVKKGGAMASSYVGGLSGAFIPVSEDAQMAAAAQSGNLVLEKLEAMTAVCSVGLDMIALPGDTSAETIAAIIADEMAIGMINNKTTAARLIPVPGKKAGEWAEFGGLLGRAPIMKVNSLSAADFICRGGRIPSPLQALTN